MLFSNKEKGNKPIQETLETRIQLIYQADNINCGQH